MSQWFRTAPCLSGSALSVLSVAAQATNDALDRGMPKKQAFWTGLMAGAFEAIFEKWSIGNFKSLKTVANAHGKDILLNIAESMLVNASEETLTEIANIAYDSIVNGDFSQYETKVRQYVVNGMTEAEAKSKAAQDLGWQVGEAAASGTLMGLGFGVTGSAGSITARAANNQAKASIGQTNATTQAATNQTNTSINQADVAESLKGKGIPAQKIDTLAEAIVARVNGQQLTKTQQSILSFELGTPSVQNIISNRIQKKSNGIDSAQNRLYDGGNIGGVNNGEGTALWDLPNQGAGESLPSSQGQTRTASEVRSGVLGALRNDGGSPNETPPTARRGIISEADVLSDNKRTDEIEVEFIYHSKYDATEFARQLADQQKGMKKLTVQEYLDNRQKYIAQGRAIEGNAAQQAAREKAYVDKVAELQDAGLSLRDAEKQAQKWLDTQAALHNPDQVAGGYADNADGVGDKRVNSSIGSQWRFRIYDVDAQVQKMAESMTESEKNSTYLNVKLTFKGD